MSTEKPYKATEVLLTTGCPDCLVILGNFTLGQTSYQSLQLLSENKPQNLFELIIIEFKGVQYFLEVECCKLGFV